MMIAGTEVVIDAIGAGSIIIDPSFIERRLRTHNKTSLSAHSLGSYRKGKYVRMHCHDDVLRAFFSQGFMG